MYVTASDSRDVEDFAASAGWIDRFLNCNNFSVRTRRTVAQKDGGYVTEKLVNFVTFSTRMIEKKKIQENNNIAIDETAVWFDMLGTTTVEARGVHGVPLRTTGHEKSHLTIVLCCKSGRNKTEALRGVQRGYQGSQGNEKHQWSSDSLLQKRLDE